jgi:catechol 2,3-dioxygenase-like lactoylglutathione lyase family enzyme
MCLDNKEASSMQRPTVPFRASNVFFYYVDLERATTFYRDILGFRLLADYGKARIFQLAFSSFLTLVDTTIGMHSSDEAKTVTLACVTPDVEGWYDYLSSRQVSVLRKLAVQPGEPHDGFVILDPEGYYLEFERFNNHTDNEQLNALLSALPPTYVDSASGSSRPPELAITATMLWLYYRETAGAQHFLQETLGLQQVCRQPIATIYAASPSGFLGAVIAGRGLHDYTEQKAVTVSLVTDQINAWYGWLETRPDVRLRHAEIVTRERYRAFVGYTPEEYYFEFNTFLEHPDNQEFLQALHPATSG